MGDLVRHYIVCSRFVESVISGGKVSDLAEGKCKMLLTKGLFGDIIKECKVMCITWFEIIKADEPL